MLKRLFSIALAALLFHAGNSLLLNDVAWALQRDAAAEKVKAAVAKRGTGPKAKVTVKLKDKTKLKGYISNAGGDSFTLSETKTGQARTFAYSDVAEVKKQGGMSLAAKIGIGVGAGIGALGLTYLIACHDDPFC
jgi:phage tail sheath gpL-like